MFDLLILTLIQNKFFFIVMLSPLRTLVIMALCIFLYFVSHTKILPFVYHSYFLLCHQFAHVH